MVQLRSIVLALLLPLAAHATITRVGHVFFASTGAGLTASVSYSPTTGNTVYVGVSAWDGTAVSPISESVSDGGTNTYALVTSQFDAAHETLYLHKAANVTGGSFTFTATLIGANMFINIFVIEYSGMGTAAGDGTQAGIGSSTTLASGNLTTTHAPDLLLAIFGAGDNNGSAMTWTPASGWAIVDATTTPNTVTLSGILEQIAVTSGTFNAQVTRSNNTGFTNSVVLAAFKGISSSATRFSVTVQ